ncbi:MAG: hypothetical protein ACRDQA_30020 [Nocardioidaceae bacterium]
MERVGSGIIDERRRAFQWGERQLAELVGSEGKSVVAVVEAHGKERRRDADVDGVPTEFKTLVNPRSAAVSRALGSGMGQAPYVIVDARWCQLMEREGYREGRRFLGTSYAYRLEGFRIVGSGFDLRWSRKRGWEREGTRHVGNR